MCFGHFGCMVGLNLCGYVYGYLCILVVLVFAFVVLLLWRGSKIVFSNHVCSLQYIYLVVLNNYNAINEEFWELYLNMSIFMFSSIMGYLFMEVPGKYAINYYMCLGVSPDQDPYDYDKVIILLKSILYKKIHKKSDLPEICTILPPYFM